jgi:hypothetical protein
MDKNFTKTQKWVELTALVTWWCFIIIVLMQNKMSWYEKTARPDMAPQNFNPWSLTFDHFLFDDSQLAINQLQLVIMTVEWATAD